MGRVRMEHKGADHEPTISDCVTTIFSLCMSQAMILRIVHDMRIWNRGKLHNQGIHKNPYTSCAMKEAGQTMQ